MPRLTPDQLRRRDQIESLIRIAQPVLNLVLRVGDRVSRVIEPEDRDYYPPRSPNLPPPTAPEGADAAARAKLAR
ncbi:MAG: hypothetical protein H0U42_06575 [Thermoleophilaceae bacterium]|nr:hypothetical protein [Thermoleophilaceae bacterium]